MPKKEVTATKPYLFSAPKTVPYCFKLTFATFPLKYLKITYLHFSGTEKVFMILFFHLCHYPPPFLNLKKILLRFKVHNKYTFSWAALLPQPSNSSPTPTPKADAPPHLLSSISSLYRPGSSTCNQTMRLFVSVSLCLLAVCS